MIIMRAVVKVKKYRKVDEIKLNIVLPKVCIAELFNQNLAGEVTD